MSTNGPPPIPEGQLPKAPPPSEGDQVAALGKELTLLDGSVVQVRFGFAQMRAAERRFGSIGRLSQIIGMHIDAPIFDAITGCVALLTGKPEENVELLLDPLQIVHYALVLDMALAEALPAVVGPGDGPGKASTSPSTGPSSTTSRPSSTGEPTPPSSA